MSTTLPQVHNLYHDHLKLMGIVSIQVTLNHFGSVDTYALSLDILLRCLFVSLTHRS